MAPSKLLTAVSLHSQGRKMSTAHPTPNIKTGQVNCTQKQFLSFDRRESKQTSSEADIYITDTYIR